MQNTLYHWAAAAVVTVSLSGQALAAEKITVFAAASLTNAMQQIATQYQQKAALKWYPRSLPRRRWRGKSSRAPRRICLSLPISSGWTMRWRKTA